MALVNSTFNVNVTPGAMPPTVHVSEYDIGRTYTVTINGENGSAFNIPAGATATIEGTLNGVIGFTTNATIDGSSVSFSLTESMTAKSGKAWCKIKLTLNDEPIQTCAFVLAVDRAGVEAETVIGAPGFEEQITNAVDNYLGDYDFTEATETAVDNWLNDHPEATTTVQDGSLTEAKFSDALKVKTIKDYVTPEMFGAKGDGVTDDTVAVQDCIDNAYQNKTGCIFSTGKTYAVSTINILNGLQSVDFCGCTLKALSSSTVINCYPTQYDVSTPNGYLKNVIIDMNNIAAIGLYVNHSWRKVFDTITINNSPNGGTALKVDGGSSCAGNLFAKVNGVTSNINTTFIEILAADNTFDNIDFANYQIGVVIKKFATISNVHGFLTNVQAFENSLFMQLSAPAIMTNVYPDTQRLVFKCDTSDIAVTISNLVLVFNTTAIDESVTTTYPPNVFSISTTANLKHISISNLSVNSSIYTNSNWLNKGGGYAVFNITGFTVSGNAAEYNISKFGTEADLKTTAATFASALQSNYPMLYAEGYKEHITITSAMSAGTRLAKWLKSMRFTPQIGVYKAVKKSASDGTLSDVYITAEEETNGVKISADASFVQGDELFFTIPVHDYLTTYYS